MNVRDLIIRRSHGFQVDHVGLGVADTEAGVAALEAKVGCPVTLHDPEPGQWYWSGSLGIGDHSFLEVIGPNPSWRTFHPFHTLLTTLPEPRLLFWYVAVSDFATFSQRAKKAKFPIQRVERVNVGPDQCEDRPGYTIGYATRQFVTQLPNVVEWKRWLQLPAEDPRCELVDFRLSHPAAKKLNKVLEAVGVEERVAHGPSSIGLSLKTPRGRLDLENPGIDVRGASMIPWLFRLWTTWRARPAS